MRRRVLLLALLLVPSGAFAQGCAGAEEQLKTLSAQLSRHADAASRTLLASLRAIHPDCPQLLLAEARLKAAEDSSSEAQELFTRYLAAMPEDASGMAYYARFLIDQAQYAQADQLSDQALAAAPGNPVALAARGQILDMKRQPQIALQLLRRSCEVDPGDADAQFQLGGLYDRAKRPRDAAEHFQAAVALDPEDARAWDYLALNLEPLGELDRADAAYRKGLAVNRPGARFDAFLDYNYGRFLVKRNQLAESKQHLDRAVEAVPDFRATWYDRARLNLELRDYTQARADAEHALSITDQTGGILDLQVYGLLERIYRRLGETALAAKYAALTRDTPPPVRKAAAPEAPQ